MITTLRRHRRRSRRSPAPFRSALHICVFGMANDTDETEISHKLGCLRSVLKHHTWEKHSHLGQMALNGNPGRLH
jgi:hypothetical protein